MKIFTVTIDSDGLSVAAGATLSSHTSKYKDEPVLKLGTYTNKKTGKVNQKNLPVLKSGMNTEIFNVNPVIVEDKYIDKLEVTEDDSTTGIIYLTPEPETEGRVVDADKTLRNSAKLAFGFIANGRTRTVGEKTIECGSQPSIVIVEEGQKIEIAYFDVNKKKRMKAVLQYTGSEFVVVEDNPQYFKPRNTNTERKEHHVPKKEGAEKKQFRRPAAPRKDFKPRSEGNYAFAGLAQQFYGDSMPTKKDTRRKAGKRRRDYDDYDDMY